MDRGTEFLDSGFDKLSGGFWKNVLESFTEGSSNNRGKSYAAIFLLLLLTYAGVEFVKIVFRKRFGKRGIRSAKMVFVVIAMTIIAIVAYVGYFDTKAISEPIYGSKTTSLYTGIFYTIVVLYISFKTFKEKGRKNLYSIHENYRGTSTVLNFLIEGGWQPSTVQNLAEPLLMLAIGVFLLPTSLLLGLPLVISATSYWIHLAAERILNFHDARDRMANKGHEVDQESAFVEAI